MPPGAADLAGKVGHASLDRAQVEALASERREAAERWRVRRERERPGPPDEVHEWLSVSAAANVLGISKTAVGKRAARGRLPFTVHDGRRWFRRDLMVLVANADEAKRERRTRLPGDVPLPRRDYASPDQISP